MCQIIVRYTTWSILMLLVNRLRVNIVINNFVLGLCSQNVVKFSRNGFRHLCLAFHHLKLPFHHVNLPIHNPAILFRHGGGTATWFRHTNRVRHIRYVTEFKFPEWRCANCSCIELIDIQRQLTYSPIFFSFSTCSVSDF